MIHNITYDIMIAAYYCLPSYLSCLILSPDKNSITQKIAKVYLVQLVHWTLAHWPVFSNPYGSTEISWRKCPEDAKHQASVPNHQQNVNTWHYLSSEQMHRSKIQNGPYRRGITRPLACVLARRRWSLSSVLTSDLAKVLGATRKGARHEDPVVFETTYLASMHTQSYIWRWYGYTLSWLPVWTYLWRPCGVTWDVVPNKSW